MRTLILGCGYVGVELGRQLRAAGREVIGVRRDQAGFPGLEAAGIRPLAADLTTPEGWAGLPASVDEVVFCLAARSRDADTYRRVYLEGIERLVTWAEGRPLRRVVYTGSTGVYAQTDGSEVDEDSPTEPVEPTARVLLEAETRLREAARAHRVPAVVLRVAGIYGPGRGYWLQKALRGEARVQDGGDRWINMIHRDDVARAILAALERGTPGEVCNVVDDEPVRQRDLIAWLARRLGQTLPAEEADSAAGENGGQENRTGGAQPTGRMPAPQAPGRMPAPSSTQGGKGRPVNRRIRNDRLRGELGVRLRFPTFREGFEAELQRLGR